MAALPKGLMTLCNSCACRGLYIMIIQAHLHMPPEEAGVLPHRCHQASGQGMSVSTIAHGARGAALVRPLARRMTVSGSVPATLGCQRG